MNQVVASTKPSVVSPLSSFAFTRAWLAQDEAAIAALPQTEVLLSERLQSLNTGTWQPWSAVEVEELRQFNLNAGNVAGAALCDRLRDPNALVVVTGQQPNLLASPLYILYKALSAIAWCRRLTEQFGRNVTPVFWVASDDEDFTELKEAWIPAWSGELVNAGRRISRGDGIEAGSPAFRWNLSDSSQRLNDDLTRAFEGWPDGEAKAEWLVKQVGAEPDFEQNFCQLLSALLGPDFPMIFVAPRLASLRTRGAGVLAKDISRHIFINKAVTANAEKFNADGYPVSLAREPEALNVFWLYNGRRRRLIRSGESGHSEEIVAVDPATQKTVRHFSDAELRETIERHPLEFAPNVVTRPIVQDTALPTLLYLAGPGELAYLAVLGTAYQQLDCVRSAVAPRSFVTLGTELVENASAEPLDPDGLLRRESPAGNQLVQEISSLEQDLTHRLATMHALSPPGSAAVNNAIEKTDKHIRRGIGQLKRRLARQIARDEWERQARRIALVVPAGKPQERMLAPWVFVDPEQMDSLAKYVYSHADFSEPGPHNIPLPPWLQGSI